MQDAVITHAVRTAIGKIGGSLARFDEQDLAAAVMKELVVRSQINPAEVDEVIFGNVKMNTRPMNVARFGWLKAGLPDTVPAYTLHRACASGSQAIYDAAQNIELGEADMIVAGGVENMSKSCYYLRGARHGVGSRDMVWFDALSEGGPGNTPIGQYGQLSMGATAENVAAQYHIPREDQDKFALKSQQRAQQAIAEGIFEEQIVDIEGFHVDEHPRATTIEQLGKLKPVFRTDGQGSVTAGNSSGRNDGASALLLMSRKKADAMGLTFYLQVVSAAVTALDPRIMGVGPIEASRQALAKAKLQLSDIGLIELNEAFASQSVAVMREWATWGTDTFDTLLERTNVNSSGIAMGHPLGATGAILTTKMYYELLRRRPEVKYGMVTMCIGGGMGFAIIYKQCRQVQP